MITTDRDIRKMEKRLTWTYFYLPSTESWTTLPNTSATRKELGQDPYLGVLCSVPGVENVRLARRAEDVEQAAYIVLWSSANALVSFQASPDFHVFLKTLGLTETVPSEVTQSPPAHDICLQWDHGFDMDTELHGRVTLNKVTGIATWESWHWSRYQAYSGFQPLGCKDIAKKRPPMRSWCITWVDQQGGEQQGMWTPVDTTTAQKEPLNEAESGPKAKKVILRGDEHVRERWEFLRWNEPSYGATREREEESTRQPGARQHWEEAIQRYTPPVQTWVQERWDIEKPHLPQTPRDENEYDDQIDMEELDVGEEEIWFEIEEDDSLPVGIR